MNKKPKVLKSIPKKKTMAIVPKQDFNVESLIATAIKEKTPVDTMERLLAMRKELKAEYAKEEFDNAMAQFQSECPVIKKSKAGGETKEGVVAYHYAPLDSIVSQVRPFISKYGFSYSIKTETGKVMVKATCIAKHKFGHSESSEMEVPLGNRTGVMSASQVTAAALTFAKRYAFCNVFGIMTGDDDNDAAPQKSAPQKQIGKPKTATIGEVEQMVRKSIKEAKTSGAVIDLDEKTQKHPNLSKRFKTEIHNLAMKKVDELDAKK